MSSPDIVQTRDTALELRAAVHEAYRSRSALEVVGGGTKSFLGRKVCGRVLPVSSHRGIVSYEPTELVITARAGTPLVDVEAALAEHHQSLPFEPPHFGEGSTIGGVMAAGLSGPRRAFAGAARDFTLGVEIVNGTGEHLTFGGQVMKNVAGYDVSRLMVGAWGTLGVLLEVSLKVLPAPAAVETRRFELELGDALERMNALMRLPLPLSGACHVDGVLYLRLSGTPRGVSAAASRLGGERATDDALWSTVRDLTHPFFAGEAPLWRLSLPPDRQLQDCDDPCLVDWAGAQRWLRTRAPASTVRHMAHQAGGHATRFGNATDDQPFHPLPSALMALHRRLKSAFDPGRILNPGKMYAAL